MNKHEHLGVILVGLYVGCILFGFMTGFHWLGLSLLIWHGTRKTSQFSVNDDTSNGTLIDKDPPVQFDIRDCFTALGRAAMYWLCNVLFWIFRQVMQPWYINCGVTISMSQSCLFHVQPTKYAACYVIHILLLVFMLFNWVMDFICLPSWAVQALDPGRKRWKLYTDNVPLWGATLALLVATGAIVTCWSQVHWVIHRSTT
eukprot:TRINITY_DN79881_c0_g1_i1.p1 TRINITY_DN79881_c0_g1~~TRINITY_DN79881_c0_g1_i1.p1  ORF type:complete len:201 (-),score=1.91 TRINITY_DN79881_c0_g1_i1:284-886(-)